MDKTTYTYAAFYYVKKNPGKTAWQISLEIGRDVSSLLKQLVDKEILTRESGIGPRGGYRYYAVRTRPRNSKQIRNTGRAKGLNTPVKSSRKDDGGSKRSIQEPKGTAIISSS